MVVRKFGFDLFRKLLIGEDQVEYWLEIPWDGRRELNVCWRRGSVESYASYSLIDIIIGFDQKSILMWRYVESKEEWVKRMALEKKICGHCHDI